MSFSEQAAYLRAWRLARVAGGRAFDAEGKPVDPATEIGLLDDLAWGPRRWSTPTPQENRHRPDTSPAIRGDHMSFDTRPGTRGARQPGGRLMLWFNKLAARRIRRKGGRMMGFNALILTTIGRKSGLERSNPVGWFPGNDGTWLIVASAAGAPGNPAWYYNLAAHPDQVRIEVNGRNVAVVAQQLHDDERTEAWEQIIAAAPRFAQYQQKTDRELPIIRLTPQSGPKGEQK